MKNKHIKQPLSKFTVSVCVPTTLCSLMKNESQASVVELDELEQVQLFS